VMRIKVMVDLQAIGIADNVNIFTKPQALG
jgi:hypothetical protein